MIKQQANPSQKNIHSSTQGSNRDKVKNLIETSLTERIKSMLQEQDHEIQKRMDQSEFKQDPDEQIFKQKVQELVKDNTLNKINDEIMKGKNLDSKDKDQYVKDFQKLQKVFTEINNNQKPLKIKANAFIVQALKELLKLIDEVKNLLEILFKAGMCSVGKAKEGFVNKYRELQFPMYFFNCLPSLESNSEKLIPCKYEFDLNVIKTYVGQLVQNSYPDEVGGIQIKEVEKIVEIPKLQIEYVEKIIEKPYYIDKIVEKEKIVYVDRHQVQQAPQIQKEIIREQAMPDQVREAHEWLFGLGRPQNISKALDIYYEQAEAHSNPVAINALGQIYLEGKYINKDLSKAIKMYSISSQMEDPEGLYRIAKMRLDGLVNDQSDSSQAIQLSIQQLESAAEQGHLEALSELGEIYQNGIPGEVEQDFKKVESYLQLAKKDRYPRAIYLFGIFYLNNPQYNELVVGDNGRKAIKYLELAAELGYLPSLFQLGLCYQQGICVNKSIEKARHFFKQGANKGDKQCKQYYQFFIMQDASNSGRHEDYQHAAHYFRKVIDEDPTNEASHYYLGYLHENGLGVNQDHKQALYYYNKGHLLGHSACTTKIGDYYRDGFHVEKNPQNAFKFYQTAAKQNDQQANFNLGMMHLQGFEGTRPNHNEAFHHFKLAAENDHPAAHHMLGQMYEDGQYVNPDHSKAVEFYKKGAVLGHLESQMKLQSKGVPHMYDHGEAGIQQLTLEGFDSLGSQKNRDYTNLIHYHDEEPVMTSHIAIHMPKKVNTLVQQSKISRRQMDN